MILSLDFDGVLHPDGSTGHELLLYTNFIHHLMDANPDLHVGVHSSWRQMHSDLELGDFLFDTRLDLLERFIGATDRDKTNRWESIVSSYYKKGEVIIVDDDSEAFPKTLPSPFRLVECLPKLGLHPNSEAYQQLKRMCAP